MRIQIPQTVWSREPHQRLGVRGISARAQHQLQLDLLKSSPIRPWPYGMPTTVNPWLLIIGISPGAGKHTRFEIQKERKHYLPSVGDPHRKFDYEANWRGTYWTKIREICIGILLQKVHSEWDALSLCGHLNIGEGESGMGNKDAIDGKLRRWVPEVTAALLRPEIVILLGMKGLRKDGHLNEWIGGPFGFIIENEPRPVSTQLCERKNGCFWIWDNPSNYYPRSVIMLPNHPSRPPMTNRLKRKRVIHQLTRLIFGGRHRRS